MRPVLMGPKGGIASPQPFLVIVDARTGGIYGAISSTVTV